MEHFNLIIYNDYIVITVNLYTYTTISFIYTVAQNHQTCMKQHSGWPEVTPIYRRHTHIYIWRSSGSLMVIDTETGMSELS